MPATFFPYQGKSPRVDPTAYVHSSAFVLGDVEIGPESSLWFYVVVRGDVEKVRIGARTNLQDHVTVHVTSGRWPTVLGSEVTVGHGAILHGCEIGDRSLVGIGSVVLDGARVGPECLVGAGSLVTPGTEIPPGHLVLGRPARPVRPLREEEREFLRRSAENYVRYAASYRSQGIV
ncbi:MAG: gamma carbonic anhydrase family protein [Candidatus Binatia bacterium]|nr:MAG: gamma carbonic anhydrase family protein [Candidatus Binatia bacterium]